MSRLVKVLLCLLFLTNYGHCQIEEDTVLLYCGETCFKQCNYVGAMLYDLLVGIENKCYGFSVTITMIKEKKIFPKYFFPEIIDKGIAEMCPKSPVPPEAKKELANYVFNCFFQEKTLLEMSNICSDSATTKRVLNECRKKQFEGRPDLYSPDGGLFTNWIKGCCVDIESWFTSNLNFIHQSVDKYFTLLGRKERKSVFFDVPVYK